MDDLFYDNFVLTEEVTVDADRHGMLSFMIPSVRPQDSMEKARRHGKCPLVQTGHASPAVVWYAVRIQSWHPVNFELPETLTRQEVVVELTINRHLCD